jgi:hypothetical protein
MLINTYKQNESRPMGFGDFIRGCVSCYQLSKDENFKFEIDLGHASEFFSEKTFYVKKDKKITLLQNKGTYEDVKRLIYKNINKNWKHLNNFNFYVFTNVWPKYTQDNNHKDWGYIDIDVKNFIKDKLRPSKILLKEYEHIKDPFEIIHIRAGDPHSFNAAPEHESFQQPSLKRIRNSVLGELVEIYKQTDNHLLILSDSNDVKNEFKIIKEAFNLDRLIILDNKPQHSGVNISIDTLHDFLHMTNSKKIHQMSVYDWGSGFSNIAHHIYDVPIIRYEKII